MNEKITIYNNVVDVNFQGKKHHLVPHIASYVNMYGSMNYSPSENIYRMSSAGLQCERQIQLNNHPELYLTKSQINEAQNLQIHSDKISATVIGTTLHELIEKQLKNTPIYVASEQQTLLGQTDYSFIGHFDLLLNLAGELVVADIKTISLKSYQYLERRGKMPKTENISQLHLYMKALGLKSGLLIYIIKDSGELAIYDIYFDNLVYNDVISRFNRIYDHDIDRELLPLAVQQKSGFPCSWCKWQKFCGRS